MCPKFLLALTLGTLITPLQAPAEERVHPELKDRFVLQAGAFFPKIKFEAGIAGSTGGEDLLIEFDERFGLTETKRVAAADIQWRYHRTWSLRAQYFDVGNKATAVLRENVEWGDAVFRAGSSVTAETGVEVLRLFFGRNFSNKSNHDYGVGLGVHRIGILAGLAGEFFIDNVELSRGERRVSFTAPLPNIGAWYAWAPSPRWLFASRADWLEATVGDYSGGLTNFALGTQYQAFPNVGIGLKYQGFRLNLDVHRNDWNGDVKVNYQGLYLHLTGNWN